MRKRFYGTVALFAAGLLAVASCGSSNDSSERTSSSEIPADASVTEPESPGGSEGESDDGTQGQSEGVSGEFILGAGGGKFRDFLEKNVIAPFQEANPDVDFKYAEADDSAFASKALFEAGSSNGSYSLLLTSSKFVNKLTAEDVLSPIDYDKVEGSDDIVANLKSEYQMPVLWAPMVLVYNTQYVTEAPTSWADYWNPAYQNKTAMLTHAEHANEYMYAAAAMEAGGHPGDSDWDIPYDKIEELAGTSKVYSSHDEMGKGLLTGESWIAIHTMGRAIQWEDDPVAGDDIAHVIPEEGTMIFLQSGIIPKNAPNPEAAHAFLSYFLKAQIEVASEFGYLPVLENVELPESIRDKFTLTPAQQELIHLDDPAYITNIEEEWSEFWIRNVVER